MSKSIHKVLEKHGFILTKEDNGWDISQYTPAGEDWHFFLGKLTELKDYVEGFDPEDEFAMWMEARHNGVAGVPKPYELWKDSLWKENVLNEVLEEIG